MSKESKLWMGNLEKWMNETKIMEFFHKYNFYPKFIQMIKNKKRDSFCNYCFIDFCNIYEANDALIKLNGKKIPDSNSNFLLKWANTNSNSKNIDIYVGNLSPEIDNFELFNLFNQKYPSVHHALIVTNNGVSKGFGFINFLKKEESENCLKEMNGYIFYNKALIVKEKINNINNNNNNTKKNSEQNKVENENSDSVKEKEEIEKESNDSDFEEDEKENNINEFKFGEFNMKFIGVIKGHKGPVTSLVCTEDENGDILLFSGSEDSSIIKWRLYLKDNEFDVCDFKEKEKIILGEPKNIMQNHDSFITSLSLNSDNTQLISSSLDKKIIIWNIYNLNPELIIKDSKSEVLATCFSSDDKIILSGQKDKKLNLYNCKGGHLKSGDFKLNGYVTCFLKIKNKTINYIAVGLSDGKVNIYNSEFNLYKEIPLSDKIKNKKELESKDEEQYSVVSLSVDEYGEYLFISYRKGSILIYSLEELDEENSLKLIIQHNDEINSILF